MRRTVRETASIATVMLLLTGCVSGSDESGSSASVLAPETAASRAVTTATSLTTPSDSAPETTDVPFLEPITGYGDFSGLTWWEIDPFQISELVVRCLRDHGFPVTYSLPGDGISFREVPPEQNLMVQAYLHACYEGLKVPSEREPPDRDVAEKVYHYNLGLADCLEDRGYNPHPPPSLETYVEDFINRSQTIWGPYAAVPFPPDDLFIDCPQTPPGGFVAWEIGDGIVRLPPMNELPPIGDPP